MKRCSSPRTGWRCVEFLLFRSYQSYSDWIQESPTLDLVNDCFRFVTGYFEIISASSPHIYHSALTVTPMDSIVRKLFESHAHPFIRIVHGRLMPWGASTVATTCRGPLESAAWSPCDRFIAITCYGGNTVDILDPATFQRLQILEFPQDIPTDYRTVIFSPDSRILTHLGCHRTDGSIGELSVVSWDLQTGGVTSVIRQGVVARTRSSETHSAAYSASGKMIGVVCCGYFKNSMLCIYDVISGALVHSMSTIGPREFSTPTWTHGDSLRFATFDATIITVWEVGFTSGAKSIEVEMALPPPVDFYRTDLEDTQFHSALCRLAIVFPGGVLVVWDVRNSRKLLDCADDNFHPRMSFSSDGHFFACSTIGSNIHLWKESPAGYILRGILTSGIGYPTPFLSRNGESIVMFGGHVIQLSRTKDFTIPPPGTLTRGPHLTKNFILEFSSDGMSAVVAMQGDNTATILNLKSGVSQLTLDAGMEVYGLGLIGNTVVVIGVSKVIVWNLPAGDHVPGTCVGVEGSSWTINLSNPPDFTPTSASISPDFRHIAHSDRSHLYVYGASTGEILWKESARGHAHRFSPDGYDIWYVDIRGNAEVWRVRGGRDKLEPLVDMEDPPEGYPWGSSCGYRITDDWWILGPDGKRLLMLPPPWQSYPVQRVWKGRFLALLHAELPEPVILELEVNRSL